MNNLHFYLYLYSKSPILIKK